MIVVDTNVIVSLFLETPETRAAETALRRDPDWAAPLLWRSEFRNVLVSFARTGGLEHRDAQAMMQMAEKLMGAREFAVPSRDVLAAAMDSGCTAYDCEFVVLARAAEVPLVTLDRGLIERFPAETAALREFAQSG